MVGSAAPLALVCLLLACQQLAVIGKDDLFSFTIGSGGHPLSSRHAPTSYSAPKAPEKPKEQDGLPMPMCYPEFNSIVEKECTVKNYASKHSTDTTVAPSSSRSREECEAEVTARELQKAIRAADANCVAQIVIQSRSVRGIEEGFRIPPEFNFLRSFGSREGDPDVAAIKGLALGILQGDKDRGLVDRLVEGIVPSFTPRPEIKPEPKKYIPPKRDQLLHAEDRANISQIYGGRAAGVTTSSSCNVTVTRKEEGNSIVVLEKRSCKEVETMKNVNATQFEETLRDRALLRNVFTADPNAKEKKHGFFGRRLFDFPGRRLQCSSCTNADGYICAYCWEEDFCSQFHWCNIGKS